jgi:lipoprotein-anchoring transpeptidase ErfK/SrfK
LCESKTERSATTTGSQVTGVWRGALLASVSALLVIGQADTAAAQFWRQDFQYRPVPQFRQDLPVRQDPQFRQDSKVRRANRTTTAKSKKDAPIKHPFGENMPKGPLQLMVSINDQRAVLYSNGVRVAETKVSTGNPSYPTPTGIFSIIQKNRWHRSNIYDNAPMYYMHRLTWSGVALHEGHLPGFAASHGCIRMPTDFVSRLWTVSRLGMRVVVARTALTPQEFSHAKLFNPAPKPVDNTPRTSRVPEGLRPSLDTAGQGFVRVAGSQPIAADSGIVTDVQGVAAAADVAADPAVTTSTDTAPAAGQVPAPARSPEPAPAATPAAAPTDPDRPAIDPDELRLPRPAPLFLRAAEPTKLNGQVAVFISGKEKRIFVRHAFVPLFDMPIEIENPAKPLGTHTFTALEAVDGGTRTRWNVISMPVTAAQPAVAPASKSVSKPQQRTRQVRGAVVTSGSSNATEALDRVAIPQAAIDRIAELLTPGSSLIISDEGLGRETGRYTEFIVETR